MATTATSPSTATPVSKASYWLLGSLLLVMLATLLAYHQVDRPLTGIDDANIFFTYASNLAGGEGFVSPSYTFSYTPSVRSPWKNIIRY